MHMHIPTIPAFIYIGLNEVPVLAGGFFPGFLMSANLVQLFGQLYLTHI